VKTSEDTRVIMLSAKPGNMQNHGPVAWPGSPGNETICADTCGPKGQQCCLYQCHGMLALQEGKK
jgi:hypothetical protein